MKVETNVDGGLVQSFYMSSWTDGSDNKLELRKDCLAKVKVNEDGIRCFSASQEAMFEKLQEAMPKNLGICRIHVAGDFFNNE